jgi:hypothetical protein
MVKRFGLNLATLAGALGIVLAGVACNAVLGIDSATVDPTFGQAEGGAPGDAGASADTGTTTPPASAACVAYCNAVVTNCPNAEYNDVPTCLALCGAFDQGQATDTSQDSLGCRAHYALLSATDPSNCPAAGPLGGGVCGNALCNTFCALDTFACTGTNAAFDGGEVGCESDCEADFNVYVTDAGNDLALSTGNTLNCRIWHLEAAVGPGGPTEITTHCPHTGVVSAFCH